MSITKNKLPILQPQPMTRRELIFQAGAGFSGLALTALLDAHRQVTETAGGYQVSGAKKVATLNIGGSGTTSVSFVVGYPN